MIKLLKSFKDYKKTSICPDGMGYEVAKDKDGEYVLTEKFQGSAFFPDDHRQIFACAATGKVLTPDDLKASDWGWEEPDMYIGYNRKVFSAQYAKENLFYCNSCGLWFKPNFDDPDEGDLQGVITEEGQYYCSHCVRQGYAYRCDKCGEWHNASHYENEGMEGTTLRGEEVHYCHKCSEFIYRCDDCGAIITEDEACFDEDGGDNIYCYNCYPNHTRNGVLKSYHFAGDETDYGMPHLKNKDGDKEAPLLGVEAEMDFGGKDEEVIQKIKDALGPEEYSVACEDGSVSGGFELVSCPATLHHHTNTLNWYNAFQVALANGYKAHDGGHCGLHVHVDRKFFQDGNMCMQNLEGAMFIMLRNNQDWIKRFSRRFDYYYCKINGEENDDRVDDMEKYRKKWVDGASQKKYDRYQAINFSRSDTIEFRVFRGTLNYKTFIATLQFVDLFARLAKKTSSLEQAITYKLWDFEVLANRLGYDAFMEYCKRIGIIDDNGTGY